MTRRRTKRSVTVELDDLIAAHPGLSKFNATWTGHGFLIASTRLFRCKDGRFSARVVYRRTEGVITTSITYVARGFVLA